MFLFLIGAAMSSVASSPSPRVVNRTVQSAPTVAGRPTSAQAAAKPAFAQLLAAHTEEELKLQLDDLPKISTSLHVEGLKPTLLSRIFGLFIR
jgi:hypothetical protein